MDLAVTSDTGPVGGVYELAGELQQAREAFRTATADMAGTLLVCLRCLPADLRRRSWTRFETSDSTLVVDLSVTEEEMAGRTTAEQREMLGALLREWLGKAFRSRSAPWTRPQRTELQHAAVHILTTLGWLDGARARAAQMLRDGHPLDSVAESTELDLGEVENMFAELTSSG
ncbi:hypothetical protein [Rhodococcus sp. ACT016]|uniref:hypothetical protein n=1 Tax=Rhodococcus sp. ACT016 TaxID=3134808 RepID=UPI003D2E4F5A